MLPRPRLQIEPTIGQKEKGFVDPVAGINMEALKSLEVFQIRMSEERTILVLAFVQNHKG